MIISIGLIYNLNSGVTTCCDDVLHLEYDTDARMIRRVFEKPHKKYHETVDMSWKPVVPEACSYATLATDGIYGQADGGLGGYVRYDMAKFTSKQAQLWWNATFNRKD